jgi:hypothetical protein
VGGFFALLDPLLHRLALVVDVNDGSVRPGERGDDEARPRKEFSEMMLDLGDHQGAIRRRGLVLEAPIAHQRGVARPTARLDTTSLLERDFAVELDVQL